MMRGHADFFYYENTCVVKRMELNLNNIAFFVLFYFFHLFFSWPFKIASSNYDILHTKVSLGCHSV